MAGLSKWEKSLSEDPMKRPFAHLQRGQDGKYNDDDLVRIMQAGIEDVAGEIRPIPWELYDILTAQARSAPAMFRNLFDQLRSWG